MAIEAGEVENSRRRRRNPPTIQIFERVGGRSWLPLSLLTLTVGRWGFPFSKSKEFSIKYEEKKEARVRETTEYFLI